MDQQVGPEPRATVADPVPARDAASHFHDALEAPYPCQMCVNFDDAWGGILERLYARAGGFEGHDGDKVLGLLVWAAVRHLQPAVVVETGVARGLTTACILSALRINGSGKLWSIDLPAVHPKWRHESGIAVPADWRGRWTYVRGPSRRRLPALLREVPPVGLFVHDSLHSAANMRFEFGLAWPSLAAGGVLVSDDIEGNRAFENFVGTAPGLSDWFAVRQADKDAMVGVAVKARPAT